MQNTGLRILAYLMVLVSIGLFVWEVMGHVVHKPHLYGIFVLGLMGAYFADPPGTRGFPRTGDALTTVAMSAPTAGQVQIYRQWVSRPMAAGNNFTTSTSFKSVLQVTAVAPFATNGEWRVPIVGAVRYA